jgi:prepilin-type N-terminal cleavage/methylation domain-containing protein
MNNKINYAPGFTLIELLIAMSILGLIFGSGVIRVVQFNRRETLRSTANNIKNDMRNIQAKALSGIKPTTGSCLQLDGWTMHFHDDVGVYEYTSYPQCDSTNGHDLYPHVIYKLPTGIRFTTKPYALLFRVLGNGVNVLGANGLPLPNDFQVITVSGYSPALFYSLCVTGGGDIKDCGLVDSSACTCP